MYYYYLQARYWGADRRPMPSNALQIQATKLERLTETSRYRIERSSPLRKKKNIPEVGHVIARWNGLDEHNKKPNGDICPKIDILAGNGQKGPLELESTPYC